MVRFIFNSINHSNNTYKNILRVKLLSVNSTFAANYQYLSNKYGLIEADWFAPLDHLLGKVKMKWYCSVYEKLQATRAKVAPVNLIYGSHFSATEATYKVLQNMGTFVEFTRITHKPVPVYFHPFKQ